MCFVLGLGLGWLLCVCVCVFCFGLGLVGYCVWCVLLYVFASMVSRLGWKLASLGYIDNDLCACVCWPWPRFVIIDNIASICVNVCVCVFWPWPRW